MVNILYIEIFSFLDIIFRLNVFLVKIYIKKNHLIKNMLVMQHNYKTFKHKENYKHS